MTPQLFDDLKRDEGLRLTAYQDTLGVWTIGYGHAHVAPGMIWTQAQADIQLHIDVARAAADLDHVLAWWRTLDDVRQDVMAELAFNMGIGALMTFHNTLGAVQHGDYAGAADGMAASLWARQVGARAGRLAAMMRTGARA